MDEIVLVPQKLVGDIAHKPIMVAKKNVMDWDHITKRGMSPAQEVLGSNCDE